MIDPSELAALHRAVEEAVRTTKPGDLPVLGFGEISLVVAWPPTEPRWAVKRLPVFPAREAFEAYADVFERYVATLRERGVDVLETSLTAIDHEPGPLTAYLVQPVVPEHGLGPAVLAAAEPSADHPLLLHAVDSIQSVVDARVGLDGQLANWAIYDGRTVYLDLTTPLLRDERGRWEVDSRLVAAMLPWVLRPPLRRFVFPGMVARFHDPRLVALDAAVNLQRLRMHEWVSPLLEAARTRIGVHLTADEVRRDYKSEARTWGALQAVRRADRAWQMHVRRRPYPFLIPDRTGW